jgi:NodT family efflux transporter outer membrane factor (OMF) lipoprotein
MFHGSTDLLPFKSFAGRSKAMSFVLTFALLGGCAVGPDFETPAAPKEAGYTSEPLSTETNAANVQGGDTQRFVLDRDIPAEWWALYHSDALNDLIVRALKANPSIDSAKAALRQAQENLYAQEGAFFPSVTANISDTREKISTASFGFPGLSSSVFSVASASLNVSYAPDIFGGTRRQVEQSAAALEYQRYQLAAAYLTLTSNVVTYAVQEASLRAQIAATQQIVDVEANLLKILRDQFTLGGATGAAVLSQQATLAQSRATLPPLEKQLQQTRNQLAVLAGRFPSEDIGAAFALTDLKLPEELPVTLPSKLVAQRPDILAAQAQLHEASAQIGIATANELPSISLTGSYGSTGSPAGQLFAPGTGVWSIAGSLAQKLFDGGTLLHERRAAVAAYDQSAAQYRSTVLSAFQDVSNALRALQSDANALAANLEAEQAAAKSLDLTKQQFQFGAVNYSALLTVEQTYQQTRVSLVQAQAARYSDTAALFQALGGGWLNNPDLVADSDDAGQKPVTVAQ